MNGYTKVDNWLFDEVMPTAKPGTYKVVCAVIRCTVGWNKESDKISLSQFQKLTGIANRTNLNNAIQDAINCGYITREASANSFVYAAKIGTESVPIASTDSVPFEEKQYRNSTSNGTDSVPKIGKNGTDSVHTKEYIKDNEITEPSNPVMELAGHFTNVAGIFPKNGAFENEWELPLTVILNGAGGDLETARERIEQGVSLARSKRYTIASPRSIVNIIANLPTTAETTGAIKISAI